MLPFSQYVQDCARATMQFATSSGVVRRCDGFLRSATVWSDSALGILRIAGVSVTPAQIAFAVMPRGPSSKASWRQCDSSADLAALTAPYDAQISRDPVLVIA